MGDACGVLTEYVFGGSNLCSQSRGRGTLCFNSRFAWVVVTMLGSLLLMPLIRYMVKHNNTAGKMQDLLISGFQTTLDEELTRWKMAAQWLVESQMQFLLLLLFGGLEVPVVASVASALFLLLGVFPKNRDATIYTILRTICVLVQFGTVIKFGIAFARL